MMEEKGIQFEFEAAPWQYSGKGGWVFVSLPKAMSEEIRNYFKSEEEGWGRLKAVARVGNSEWKTAIWFDTKAATYMLPLKADVRKKEGIQLGVEISLSIWV